MIRRSVGVLLALGIFAGIGVVALAFLAFVVHPVAGFVYDLIPSGRGWVLLAFITGIVIGRTI